MTKAQELIEHISGIWDKGRKNKHRVFRVMPLTFFYNNASTFDNEGEDDFGDLDFGGDGGDGGDGGGE